MLLELEDEENSLALFRVPSGVAVGVGPGDGPAGGVLLLGEGERLTRALIPVGVDGVVELLDDTASGLTNVLPATPLFISLSLCRIASGARSLLLASWRRVEGEGTSLG